MNTDKNGWPYLIGIFFTFSGGGVVIASDISPFWTVVDLAALLWFFGFSMPLFLTLAFSEKLKPVSLHKKFIFSLCPLMYFHLPTRYWVLKQLAPERDYQQFLKEGAEYASDTRKLDNAGAKRS